MGALDELIANSAQSIAGDGIILGALIFILFAYIAFRSGIPLSGMIFIGILLMGALVALGLLNIMIFAAVLIVGAFVFWRGVVATGG